MDPLLFERIRYLKAELKNVRVHFNTNAALLTEEKARAVLASGLTSIAFSVDGTSPETYGHVKTGLRYERTVENVRRFLALRKEAGGRRPHVTMQMVVTDANRHEVAEYRRLWSDHVDEVFVKAMLNFLVQGTSIKTGALTERMVRRCFQPATLAAVYHDGRAALCCWDYDHLAELGSVADQDILDIFNGEELRRVRAAMLAMDCRDVAPCNVCSMIYGHDMDSDYDGG
jgi:sulfatase maturation enzyme AslB (radical SAM superfamily)